MKAAHIAASWIVACEGGGGGGGGGGTTATIGLGVEEARCRRKRSIRRGKIGEELRNGSCLGGEETEQLGTG